MSTSSHNHSAADSSPEHFDVLIVGAGISGISSAYYLTRNCENKRFVILDALDAFGGTWVTHKYPGTRSDSDLFTFGYSFKPWTGPSTATREQILSYLGDVIEENQLTPHIRYRHSICSASWSSETNRWTIKARRTDTDELVTYTTNFLWMCQGYYRHQGGYTPDWPGMETYGGQIVHPQHWPDDLDCNGKNILVIGSGATAATLVPALAEKAAHVTMLQRTPTYFATERASDALADELRRLNIDQEWIHEIIRRKVTYDRTELLETVQNNPDAVKQHLLAGVEAHLGKEFDIEKHFTPPYRPMQQRVAFIPEGDLFRTMKGGHASIVTDEIEAFTERGVQLKSGDVLVADIIVTATGFNMSALGDIAFEIDSQPLNFADTVTYRGMMFTGFPNMAWIFGYSYHSWTLRAELIGEFVCRLLNHMGSKGVSRVTPSIPERDKDMKLGSWVNPEDFNPGYMMRSLHLLPKCGDKPEWRHSQDYLYESKALPAVNLDDDTFCYEN